MIRNVLWMNKSVRLNERIFRAQQRESRTRWRSAIRQIVELLGCNPAEIRLSGQTIGHLYAEVGDLRFYLDGSCTKHYLIFTCCPICEGPCRLIRPPRLPELDLCTVMETIALQEAAHAQTDLA